MDLLTTAYGWVVSKPPRDVVLALGAALFVAYQAAIVVYRLYFSPLRNVPGLKKPRLMMSNVTRTSGLTMGTLS